MKTALNNVLLPALLKVVNNTEHDVEPELAISYNNVTEQVVEPELVCNQLFSSGQNRLFVFCCVCVCSVTPVTLLLYFLPCFVMLRL